MKKLLVSLLFLCLLLTLMPVAMATEPTPTLPANVDWDANPAATVTDGTNYYATMKAALEGIHNNPSLNTLYCKPGADVGVLTHGHVCQTLTVYGNGAYISGGERDFEVDQYGYCHNGANVCANRTGDLTLTVNNLTGTAVWGTRNTTRKVDIVLNDCKNMERVYMNYTAPGAVTNVTLTGCTFDYTATGAAKASSCAVYNNCDGAIVIENCTFTGVPAAVNINHKDAGMQTTTVKNSTFTDCSTSGVDANMATYAAPIRVVSAGSASAVTKLNVESVTFNYVNGQASDLPNSEILLGDGRDGKTSHAVELTITDTAAQVETQKPGDVTAGTGTVQTVAKTETATVGNAVAMIGTTKYATLDAALQAATATDTITLLPGTHSAQPLVLASGERTYPFAATLKIVGEEGAKLKLTSDFKSYQNGTAYQFYMAGSWYVSSSNIYFENIDFLFEDTITTDGQDMAEIQLFATGTTSFVDCTFDNVCISAWGQNGTNVCAALVVDGCTFSNLTKRSAIHQTKASSITVTDNTFTNGNGGVHIASKSLTDVTITGNTFTGMAGNIITLAPVGEAGDMSAATFTVTGNNAAGQIFLRSLNDTVPVAAVDAILDKTTSGNVYGTAQSADSIVYEAELNGKGYKTLAEALALVQNGDTVILRSNVELTATITISDAITFTLDGNGYTITKGASYVGADSVIMLGNTGVTTIQTGANYTVKNLTLSGWTGVSHILRIQGATALIENCAFTDNTAKDILSVTFANVTVRGCLFEGNVAPLVMDINTNSHSGSDAENNVFIVDGCDFMDNNSNYTGPIYYHRGASLTMTNCRFGNNVSSIATVFTGIDAKNATLTGNVFSGNTGGVAKDIFVEGDATVTGNAFADAGEDDTVSVYVDKFGEGQSSLNGNYWGGDAPLNGVHFVTVGETEVQMDIYYGDAAIDGEGNLVLTGSGVYYTAEEQKMLEFLLSMYRKEFPVTTTVGTGATLSSFGGNTIRYGTSRTYTVTMTPGFSLVDVVVNGESLGAVTEFTLNRVMSAQTIEVITDGIRNPYKDVDASTPYYGVILELYQKGIMIGDGENFYPNNGLLREQLVTVLWRAAGQPDVFAAAVYDDMDADAYYAKAIVWATDLGLVNGYGDGTFGVGDVLTREQLCTIMYRWLKHTGGGFQDNAWSGSLYPDMTDVRDWAAEAMVYFANAGVLPMDDGRLAPATDAARWLVAAMVYPVLTK